jgi:hypothetical protein
MNTDRRSIDVEQPAPTVVIVEPYHGAEGHFSKTAGACAAALRLAGADVIVVTDAEGREPLRRESRNITRFRLAARLARLARRILRFVDSRTVWRLQLGEAATGLEALVRELPTLATAVNHAKQMAISRPTGIVIMSSRARPYRHKAAVAGGIPTVDFAFDHPVGRTWALSGLPDSYRIVATTQRVSGLLASAEPPVIAPVISHLPVTAPAVSASTERITQALARVTGAPEGWLLFFGAMHGKKNLSSIADLAQHLPETVGLLVAGDPLVDGLALVETTSSAAQAHPHIAVIADRLSDQEAAALLGANPVVLVADHPATVSLSGVLIDALGAGCPVIAPADCASGDVTRSTGVGAAYSTPTPSAIIDAFKAVAHTPRPVVGDTQSLAANGLFPDVLWGQRLLDLLGLPRHATAPQSRPA